MKRAFIVLLLVCILAASVFSTTGKHVTCAEEAFAEEVNLIWVQPSIESIEANKDAIMEAINDITRAKINTTITLMLIPFAEYQERLNMMYTAGERWDVTQGGFCNPIPTGVAMGAFAPIPRETLEEFAPEYMRHFDDSVWNAVTFNGQIYACPIEQQWANQYCASFNETLTDKYEYDYTQVHTLEDLEEFLSIIKENEPDVVPIQIEEATLGLMCNYFGWDTLVSYNVPGVVYDKAESPVVVNQFETEEFRELLDLTRHWYQAGYIVEDAATGGASATGKPFAVGLDVYVPGRRAMLHNLYGAFYNYSFLGTSGAMKTSKVQEHCQVISSGCEHLDRAVAFINLLNTDEELLNLYIYGIPGEDWVFADEENKVVQSIGSHYAYDFFVGNTLNTYYNDPTAIGAHEEMRRLNEAADVSCLLGFTFDLEPVSSQIALCTAVTGERLPGLVTGTVDPETELEIFIQELKNAGSDDILEEMQRQIDAWMANR